MKYLKKKKKSILPWVLVALTVVLVGLILVLTLLPGSKPATQGETTAPTAQGGEIQPSAENNPSGETGESQAAEGSEPTQSTEEPTVPTVQPQVEDLRIETPYAVLVYPGEWSGLIQVDKIPGDPYRVVFTAKLDSGIQQELFTIRFGGGQDGAMGVLKVSGKEVPVHVSAVEIKPGNDWTDNEISVVYSMQEGLNDVLAGLNLTTPQEEPQEPQNGTLPPEDDETMSIDTPAGELYYPARWKDYLKLEVIQEGVYTLEFYANLEGFEPVPLFNVYLGGDQGIYVMDLTASDGSVVKLYVEIHEIEADINWTDAQKAIVFAMQEDMNFLLSALME